ncbi:lectin [Boletus edulis]|uniref:Lectin n=1 Tax=Boletus edulis BED1 TaxID=1328754 RepID=A0AAD4G6T9_BOLED|nr:lectin [Boletus edulis]KAF8422320.1 lectin [Boletus edulis BED1]
MSYTITLRVFQRNPARGFFSIVEKVNFAYGGTWSKANGTQTLNMSGSGTSGVLRFKSDKGELFTVAVGVHNYKRWCDVVTGLKPEETGLVINPQYYNGPRDYMREKQLAEYNVTSLVGTRVEVKYTVADGNNLQADIIIG